MLTLCPSPVADRRRLVCPFGFVRKPADCLEPFFVVLVAVISTSPIASPGLRAHVGGVVQPHAPLLLLRGNHDDLIVGLATTYGIPVSNVAKRQRVWCARGQNEQWTNVSASSTFEPQSTTASGFRAAQEAPPILSWAKHRGCNGDIPLLYLKMTQGQLQKSSVHQNLRCALITFLARSYHDSSAGLTAFHLESTCRRR